MALQQSPNDIETEPCPFADGLCREKRVKDAAPDFGRDASTVVDNFDCHKVELARARYCDMTTGGNSVECIVDQVHPYLIELGAHSMCSWKVVGQIQRNLD